MLADYTRRGFLEGVGIRLPSIVRAAGQAEQGGVGLLLRHHPRAAGRAGGVLPVADSVLHTHASPRSAVGFLIHAAGLTREQIEPTASTSPCRACAARSANRSRRLRRIAGDKVAARIRRAARRAGRCASSPAGRSRFDARRAAALGFKVEATFDEIIRVHIEEDLGGKIVN